MDIRIFDQVTIPREGQVVFLHFKVPETRIWILAELVFIIFLATSVTYNENVAV